ncbi:choice-of-anchor J domain-containing protein [Fulvivirga ligni]|uniref:choice-of-anchor J domain-containing protein n=1 Tax=Fulvivirga ligni TaxID=2904246 RepID=UPI001F33F311|nr:choice-of-anchor J domain-containing protein [Fulvivirga ligni]UII22773.1 DUF5017 domain-containing protein [Fulvivirga ligni]
MKRFNIIFGLSFLSLALMTACDPLEEEIDQIEAESSINKELTITLTEDDYALLEDFKVGTYNNFSSEDEAKQYVPYILEELYPQLGNGSSITVKYNLYRGSSESVSQYTGADNYQLTKEDYEGISTDAGKYEYLNDQYPAKNYIPSILSDTLKDAEDGELVAVNYSYSSTAYGQTTSVYSENFNDAASFNPFAAVSVTGDQEWEWSSYSGDGFAKISGFAGSANENFDYLITPAIDLSGFAGGNLTVNHAINYRTSAVFGEDIAVLISTDYGVVGEPTWTSLEFDTWPAGNNWTFVDSKVDISDYAGETVYLAFKYTSTSSDAATWEVSSILIGESTSLDYKNLFYTYNAESGKWSMVDQDAVYYLNSDDYDAMGAPGAYDNFSSSTPADSYIPTFLTQKYPYAQEEQEIVVVYKYYSSSSGGLQTRGNVYTFLEGSWSGYASEIEAELQFGKENGVWVPDNTIRYTFTTDDFSAVAENEELGTAAARDNLATYGNFSTYNWTLAEIDEAVGFILKKNFPNSEVGQKYLVSFDSYPSGLLTTHLILNSEGNYVPVN